MFDGDDLQWVQVLTVLMHLGLIDRHHNISAQESSVHLPKFQMAPGHKILMYSVSKKGKNM
jgi:hypothetical protein